MNAFKNFKFNKIYLFIIIFIMILLIIAGFFLFSTKFCIDKECFSSSLAICKKASWIKEDDSYVWHLTILGNNKINYCKIKIELLKIKKGTLDSEKLEYKEMECSVMKTETEFPPKDMSQCTGSLKEELQDILIKRMHDYILKNLGDIKQEFQTI